MTTMGELARKHSHQPLINILLKFWLDNSNKTKRRRTPKGNGGL